MRLLTIHYSLSSQLAFLLVNVTILSQILAPNIYRIISCLQEPLCTLFPFKEWNPSRKKEVTIEIHPAFPLALISDCSVAGYGS